MTLPNKVYDVLKWLCIVFIPASITLFQVIAGACDIPYSEKITTIAIGVDTFLGTILGISSINYHKDEGDTDE